MGKKKLQIPVPDYLLELSELAKQNRSYDIFRRIYRERGINFSSWENIPFRERGYYDAEVRPDNQMNISYFNKGGQLVSFCQSSKIQHEDMISTPSFPSEQSTIVYVEPSGLVWMAPVKVQRVTSWGGVHMETRKDTLSVSIGEWKPEKKYVSGCFMLNTRAQIDEILKRTNPYGYKYAFDKFKQGIKTLSAFEEEEAILITFPAYEQLLKAGYGDLFPNRNLGSTEMNCLWRLIKDGADLKEIFQTPKMVYKAMKGVNDLKKWDVIRKMVKTGKLMNKEDINNMLEANFSGKEMELVSGILNKEYKGKKLFTMSSLTNYLHRIDMNEAIGREEGLTLLSDYLRCCETIDAKPKIDSDSLKREHDVAARLCRQYVDKQSKAELDASCSYLDKYNYQEKIFHIRGIRGYDDLIDEANQQRNCVASYAKAIIAKRSLIYVMRTNAEPNKSLVTVELSPEKTIRQAFQGYNQPISQAQHAFLKRWLYYIRTSCAD